MEAEAGGGSREGWCVGSYMATHAIVIDYLLISNIHFDLIKKKVLKRTKNGLIRD